MPIDAIVAGVGIWGCTVAGRLAEAGKRVVVLEKCPMVGGNVRCEIDRRAVQLQTWRASLAHASF